MLAARNVFRKNQSQRAGLSIRQFSGDGAKRTRGPRNTKNYDWYFNALEKQAQTEKTFQPIECFPKAVGPRSKAFFDLTMNGEELGRVSFVLCDDLLPRTCENFKLLCDGKGEYKYENTIIHRIVRNQLMMGGDVEMQNGMGGHSAFGSRYFDDEAFVGLHNSHGILSMINGGIHTNNSQFFITLQPQRQLNGRNIAFGYVEDGSKILEQCGAAFTFQQKPLSPIVISKAGLV